jgi:hypothetical protein
MYSTCLALHGTCATVSPHREKRISLQYLLFPGHGYDQLGDTGFHSCNIIGKFPDHKSCTADDQRNQYLKYRFYFMPITAINHHSIPSYLCFGGMDIIDQISQQI